MMSNDNDDWKRYIEGRDEDEFWPDDMGGEPPDPFFKPSGYTVQAITYGGAIEVGKSEPLTFKVRTVSGVKNLYRSSRPGYPNQMIDRKTLLRDTKKFEKAGITTIFVLLCDGEYLKYYGLDLIEYYRGRKFKVHPFPIPDFGVPRIEFAHDLVLGIEKALKGGEKVLVHCSAGLGRTGLAINCLITKKNMARKKGRQIELVSSETGSQRNFLTTFKHHLSRKKGKKRR
jgi:protein-tyrosine phosphatase